MTKEILKQLIEVASGRAKASLVLKNGNIVDVYSHAIRKGDIAIVGEYIAAVGDPGVYRGDKEIDLQGAYVAPGFIDSHIHIESSYVSPEELGRLTVPHGTSTIIADPHEIVNVAGLEGFRYMQEAAKHTKLDIKYMLPSCVPATPFETAGATIEASDMTLPIQDTDVLGLGEFMNYPGIVGADQATLDKIMVAHDAGKLIDGHSPGLEGSELAAYGVAGIHTDHECSTLQEMQDRLQMGMYILLRQGTACHDIETLLQGVTVENARRCLFCSDDRNVETILEVGHLEEHLRMAVAHGIDPITAIQMASLNATECYRLTDRGAIAPRKLANIVILEDLQDFKVTQVFLKGELVAKNGQYLPKTTYEPIAPVQSSMHVANFCKKRLALPLKSAKAHVIGLTPGGVVTEKKIMQVSRDKDGLFQFANGDGNDDGTAALHDRGANPHCAHQDIAKVAVIERHKQTGNVGLGLLHGFGIQHGAIAISIAHDSHNIITVGVNDDDITLAVETLIAQGGGVVLAKNGVILETLPMPIAGLMSDRKGEWVAEKLRKLNNTAYQELTINPIYEPVMTLCFMSLAVIPEIKLTDKGLFDVTTFSYIDVDALS